MVARWSRWWLRLGSARKRALIAGAAVPLAAVLGLGDFGVRADGSAGAKAGTVAAARTRPEPDALELSAAQLGMIDIAAASIQRFPLERTAVGSIDFNEDMSAQVFPSYPGRIAKLFVLAGDNVRRGQPLLTIESPI